MKTRKPSVLRPTAGKNISIIPTGILHPMKNVGTRGAQRWVPISWDQALDEIAARAAADHPMHTAQRALLFASADG